MLEDLEKGRETIVGVLFVKCLEFNKNFNKTTHDDGEDGDTEDKDEDTQDSFIVSARDIITEADSRQSCKRVI